VGIIDDAGFQKESFSEWVTIIQAYVVEEDGEDADLSPTGAWGQVINIGSKLGVSSDEVQEESYNARDPDNATGNGATKLAAETGTYRKSATFTQVDDVLLEGTEGAVLTIGTQVTQAPDFLPPSGLVYELIEAITITKTACRIIELEADEESGAGFIYTVTIDSTPYTYTTLGGETQEGAIDSIIGQLPVGLTGTKTGTTILTIESVVNMNASWSATFTIEKLWSAGDFLASIAGVIVCQPSSLTVIVTAISGWNEVTNPVAGVTGNERENDTQLMIRRRKELIKGKATNEAITTALSNVDNVSFGVAISNRTMFVVDGQNAKSVESIVTGGADDDIAQAIYDSIGGGIEYFGRGGNQGTATDPLDGQTFIVPFSRPTPRYIHVRFTRIPNTEQTYPVDGDNQVKAATEIWGNDRYTLGEDVVRTELCIPFYQVPGSILTKTEFALTVLPGDSPSWVETDTLTLASFENAEFAADRVFILIGP
jgi:hypothetical protein